VLSAGAFVFKGSGFYATDYKSKEQKKEKAEAPSCEACTQAGGCPAAKNPE
jgi:predicted nucleic acid-binding Zn ribbon protein